MMRDVEPDYDVRGIHWPDVAESSLDRLWLLKLSGELEYWNSKGEEIFPTADNHRRSIMWREIWPIDSQFAAERGFRMAANGQTSSFKALLPAEDGGGSYWETSFSPVLDGSGGVERILATSRDVTREVETYAFVHSIVQLLPCALTVKNLANGRYILANRAAEELLDRTADEIIGQTELNRNNEAEQIRLGALEAAIVASGQVHVAEEDVPASAMVSSRRFQVKRVATYDDCGPRHLISIWDDVTDARALAASLHTALSAAEQANRAKSLFLSNMGHEVRTPLNGVVAAAELLAGHDLAPASAELVEMIRASSLKLERLLSNVMDVAALGERAMVMHSAPFGLADVVQSVAASAKIAADAKGLSVVVRCDLWREELVHGDANRIAQVLKSLLDNAVKFTERGEVRLDVRPTVGEMMRFEIKDTGVGFDPAIADRLFEGFQQADGSATRRFDGLGLGLAISKSLVELMGGRIGCESEPDAGSCFWFEAPLPRSHQPTHVDSPSAKPKTSVRVLLADDHPTNRKVVETILASLADVVSVGDGQQAVDAFVESRPDVILMDMQMPVMDGISAVRAIRRLEQDGPSRTPIIMLTANTLPEHVAAAAEAGADLHLGKPVRAAALISTIGSCLAHLTEGDRVH